LFKEFDYDILAYARHIVKETWKLVGIPISIGIAPTKTLAKVANKMAKKDKGSQGAIVMQESHEITMALSLFPVEDLWGVGYAKAKKLSSMGIKSALDFRELPGDWVLKNFTITGYRMWRELHGEPCMNDISAYKKKEAVATGRTFGKLLINYEEVKEALVNHAASCAHKLRKQKSYASYLDVQIETSRFRTDLKQYVNHFTVKLLQPTDDTRIIIKSASEGVDRIWKEGYQYNRCGALLLGLMDAKTGKQESLFEQVDRDKSQVLMKTLDYVNGVYGKNTLKLASQGDGKAWALRRVYLSPRYLTRLQEFIDLKS
jgi:DNA polymerase V